MSTSPIPKPTFLPAREPAFAEDCGPRSGEFSPHPPEIQPNLKTTILAAIAAHVRVFGRRQWDVVRERPAFAHLIGREAGINGKRRFWRWVNAVCEPTPADKTRPHEARGEAAASLHSATERARLAAKQNLPAAPSPAYLMRAGADAAKNIDFLASIGRIWADAERLRGHAMRADENAPDGLGINDAKLFDASIKRRLEVMESALQVMREVWDLEYQQRFYEGITRILVDELAPVPEIQERVIKKLAELNNSRGMTIHAEVR